MNTIAKLSALALDLFWRTSSIKTRLQINNVYHLLFIIGAPIIAFTAVTLVSMPRASTGKFLADPSTPEWFIALSALMTHAHVMMVFSRSHLNKTIFNRFPFRFTLIPIIALCAFTVSPVLAGVMAIVALYWDEWHSLMQIFGFSRMYDTRAGNDPYMGRKLDMGICFVIGLLPHILLLTYLPDAERPDALLEVLNLHPDYSFKYGHLLRYLREPLMAFGLGYIVFYLLKYWQLKQEGYKVSKEKVALLGATGFCAIIIASFYSIADAGHFMNLYHSIQYIFIVCIMEGPLMSQKLRFPRISKRVLTISVCILMVTMAFAAAIARLTDHFTFLGNFWLLSSLLHFWYDGFIWSVRKQDI